MQNARRAMRDGTHFIEYFFSVCLGETSRKTLQATACRRLRRQSQHLPRVAVPAVSEAIVQA